MVYRKYCEYLSVLFLCVANRFIELKEKQVSWLVYIMVALA